MPRAVLIFSRLMTYIATSIAIGACAKAPRTAPQSNTNPTSDPSPQFSSNVPGVLDLCQTLKASTALMSQHATLIQRFCDRGQLTQLSQPPYQYRGMDEVPELLLLAQERPNKQTEMQLGTSLASQIDARSYYEMLRMQIMRPDEFKQVGFETDSAVQYTPSTVGADTVAYRYKNTSSAPFIVVDYEASTSFLTLKANSTYVVTTSFSRTYETVVAFKGVIIINAINPTTVAVYSLADQTYENNNDHPKTVEKARAAFITDLQRSYRNSLKAPQLVAGSIR